MKDILWNKLYNIWINKEIFQVNALGPNNPVGSRSVIKQCFIIKESLHYNSVNTLWYFSKRAIMTINTSLKDILANALMYYMISLLNAFLLYLGKQCNIVLHDAFGKHVKAINNAPKTMCWTTLT